MGDSITKHLNEAIRLYNATQYEKALIACNQAIHLDPNCARAYHGRGLIRVKQRRYKEALEDYQKSCKLNSKNSKLHADMGELFFTFHDYDKAGLHYREALQLDKQYEFVYQQKTQELLDKAFNERDSWGLRKENNFQQVLLFNPDNAKARSEIARMQQVRAKTEQTMNQPRVLYHYSDCRCPQCVNYN